MLKQVIIIRKDLNMRKGKMIAQGAHASLSAYMNCRHRHAEVWRKTDQTKICLYVTSEKDLVDLAGKAASKQIPFALITDAGKTEFHNNPTITALALGPYYSEELDTITGNLPLL